MYMSVHTCQIERERERERRERIKIRKFHDERGNGCGNEQHVAVGIMKFLCVLSFDCGGCGILVTIYGDIQILRKFLRVLKLS